MKSLLPYSLLPYFLLSDPIRLGTDKELACYAS